MEERIPTRVSADLETIRNYCMDRKLKIAAAESATAGFVQALLSTMRDAGLFYQGGITTYTCQMKSQLLGIPLEKCEVTNGVDLDIADLMAKNICGLYQADIGVAITGYASEIPELGILNKYAFGSICLSDELILRCEFLSLEVKQLDVQRDFAMQLIHALANCLKEDRPIRFFRPG